MHDSRRVGEGRNCSTLLATKMKARTVAGGGSSDCYVTPDLSYEREGASAKIIDGMQKDEKKIRGRRC